MRAAASAGKAARATRGTSTRQRKAPPHHAISLNASRYHRDRTGEAGHHVGEVITPPAGRSERRGRSSNGAFTLLLTHARRLTLPRCCCRCWRRLPPPLLLPLTLTLILLL